MLWNTQMSCVLLTAIIMRRASIMPSIMYKLLVNPPAHKGPRMVARPPTERLTPWLNPFGDASQRITGYSFHLHSNIQLWLENTARMTVALHHLCCDKMVNCKTQTLCFLCSDFGEERHLRHGHKGKPQQLQKHSDDEGRQLPSITTWQGWKDKINEINGLLNYSCLHWNCMKHIIKLLNYYIYRL